MIFGQLSSRRSLTMRHYAAVHISRRTERTYASRSFDFQKLDMEWVQLGRNRSGVGVSCQVQRYQFLCGCIIPRPIAVISSVDSKGINNISVVSFFAPVTSNPPTLSFSLTVKKDNTQKDTYHNIHESKHFVISSLTPDYFDKAYACSQEFPPHVDEFKVTGLTPVPSVKVIAPRILEAPVSLECSLFKSVPIGDGKYGSSTLIVGEVLYAHINEDYCNEKGELISSLNTVSRLGGLLFGEAGKGWEVENAIWSTKNW